MRLGPASRCGHPGRRGCAASLRRSPGSFRRRTTGRDRRSGRRADALGEVVHVVAAGQGFAAAARAVLVVGGVGSAVVLRSAGDGILRADLDRMLVVVALVGVMEVAVVQIVDVTVVFDGGVSAAGAVDMLMGMMDYVFGHDSHSLDFPTTCASPA